MPTGGINPNAWHNWYHCVGSTYGTWLRGDPRGFRTFRHREHVEGDYKNPPNPGVWEPVFEISKAAMKHPPVTLDHLQRRVVCKAMVEKLELDQVECVALAIGSNHFHLLARFPAIDHHAAAQFKYQLLEDGRDPSPRYYLSRARRNASFALRGACVKPVSRVWAARPKCLPIGDRSHQVNVARYIALHTKERAAVWIVGKGFRF